MLLPQAKRLGCDVRDGQAWLPDQEEPEERDSLSFRLEALFTPADRKRLRYYRAAVAAGFFTDALNERYRSAPSTTSVAG
jgi:hypothetical protein